MNPRRGRRTGWIGRMSLTPEPTDDVRLPPRLQAELRAAYAGRPEVPAAVDQRILKFARAHPAGQRRRRPWLIGMGISAAAAAAAVVAIALRFHSAGRHNSGAGNAPPAVAQSP